MFTKTQVEINRQLIQSLTRVILTANDGNPRNVDSGTDVATSAPFQRASKHTACVRRSDIFVKCTIRLDSTTRNPDDLETFIDNVEACNDVSA
ncbi:hypothetical protein EVAR_54843_1 [Eumeta japonica]|uniref:Uncharacterized protein n=1 Tax=Eumeta variegata TaxID=151549 RepID=A0A4C1ZHX9_EUMVA|nr:hypothetical protein EVAR_54843_1 [Eumeta japonica]